MGFHAEIPLTLVVHVYHNWAYGFVNNNWSLVDLIVILQIELSVLLHWFVSADLPMIMPFGECHWTFTYKSTLVQIMAWCRQATIPYLSLQCWSRSNIQMYMLPCDVTRLQWVKPIICLINQINLYSDQLIIKFIVKGLKNLQKAQTIYTTVKSLI